jgi:hypothetical protein
METQIGLSSCLLPCQSLNLRSQSGSTGRAYVDAIVPFLAWCEERGCAFERIGPVLVATYIEKLLADGMAKPSVKQHLAAIRMLFDYMVTGGVLPSNPASSVRRPRYSVRKGKTSVLSAEEMHELLAAIDISSLLGLRRPGPHRPHGLHHRPGRGGSRHESPGLLRPKAPRLGTAERRRVGR